jgi:hypothetical protein
VQVYSVPRAPHISFDTERSAWDFDLQHLIYNVSYEERQYDEQLLLDAEVNRTDFGISHRQVHKKQSGHEVTEIHLNLPWISHSGGNTDSAITTWHDWFGFPNGNRDQRPDNTFIYHYERGGKTLVNLSTPASGLADAEIYWQRTYIPEIASKRQQTIQIGASLPTGKASKLLGSNNLQLSAQWQAYQNLTPGKLHLDGFIGTGFQYHSKSGFLDDHLKQFQLFAHLGVIWHWSEKQQITVQVASQSATYKSELDSLGSSTQLSIGLNSSFKKQWSATLFFTEDINVNTSPDFGLGIKITYKPNNNI